MSHSSKQMETDDVLRVELKTLKMEHRELDEKIKQFEEASGHDVLTIRRLKKQKLRLKDEISSIEDKLTPDIIA